MIEQDLIDSALEQSIPSDNVERSIRMRLARKIETEETGRDIQSSLDELLGRKPEAAPLQQRIGPETVAVGDTAVEQENERVRYLKEAADIELACLAAFKKLLGDEIIGRDVADAERQMSVVSALEDRTERPESHVKQFVRRFGMMAIATAMFERGRDATQERVIWAINEATLAKSMNKLDVEGG
jgi:hypothetical protein